MVARCGWALQPIFRVDRSGVLSRSGKALDSRYFNVVNGFLYLESRAYNSRYTYTYTVPASESKRFQRSYTEGTGTSGMRHTFGC